MVVDDDGDLRLLLPRGFKRALNNLDRPDKPDSVSCILYETAEAALAALAESLPDVVLVDIHIQGTNIKYSADFIRQVHEEKGVPLASIWLWSGMAEDSIDSREILAQFPGINYLQKSVDMLNPDFFAPLLERCLQNPTNS